ncbi:flagellar basal body rod protein FlgC [Fictibacillus nanhaiensis]|uniref:flagellar basal body rod protein FlgC n=1 Tax=Fictibacillus nanhaiensis TaxID=742169 RepID=UPI001C969B73|nr:flagellar basal body rod protein FlgC [Fictibacillus nanhaiensis]MBY6036098.1 flagellar basal body rod protein FlgC [Fictibacillus nanhaiensis]
MGVFDALNVSASGLTAQRLRMDVASANMANVDTTRGRLVNGEWEPYKRKMVVLGSGESSFKSMYNKAVNKEENVNGVRVNGIIADDTPFKSVYQPDHPDANEEGFVQLPNVDPLKEMVDLMSATRSYEANVTALNAAKGMYLKALEIGR